MYPKMHKTAEDILGKMKGSNKKRSAAPGDADPLEETHLEGTVQGDSEDGPKPAKKKKAGHFLSQGKGVTDFPDPDQPSAHEIGPAMEEPHLAPTAPYSAHKQAAVHPGIPSHAGAAPKRPLHQSAVKHIQPHDTRTAQAPEEQGVMPNQAWMTNALRDESEAPGEEAAETPEYEAHEEAAMGHPTKGKSDEEIASGFHAQLRKHFGVTSHFPKALGKRGAKRAPVKSGY